MPLPLFMNPKRYFIRTLTSALERLAIQSRRRHQLHHSGEGDFRGRYRQTIPTTNSPGGSNQPASLEEQKNLR